MIRLSEPLSSRRAAIGTAVAALLAAATLSGCETVAYYSQAIGGHLELMARAQPVAHVLADRGTAPELRERLTLARSIRDFASRELKLPDNASYRSYADLGRPYAVWNVVATPEFSLAPVRSCFPVAGCVSYRGFFAPEDAARHAQALRAAGHDVFVYGVPAYSTLGRFDDPLLSTFIRHPEAELARLLFHELAHHVVYVKDDSTFNESFAVAVEREGVRRWLTATGREAELRAWREASRRGEEFGRLLDAARLRLGRLYAEGLAPEATREKKRSELAALVENYRALRRGWGDYAGYDRLFEPPPNNAMLASFATYTGLVPAFERLLAEQGGDLERFYARVRQLAASAPSSRGPLSAPSR
jgi:predicted aminopeptidase